MPPKTTRGHPLAYSSDGFEYRWDYTSKDGSTSSWRCTFPNCKATATGAAGSIDVSKKLKSQNHSHLVQTAKKVIRERLTEAKEQARSNINKRTRDIVQETNRNLNPDEAILVAKRSAQMRQINRVRHEEGNEDVDVDNAKDIKFYDQLIKIQGQKFLLYDSRDTEPNRDIFFIFGTEDAIVRLRQYREWSADGTFSVSPKSFYQLYTINVLIGESSLPSLYILTQKKLKSTYKRLFAQVKVLIGFGTDPLSLMTDFEFGAQVAAKETWPNLIIRSCLFHLTQSIWRNVQSLGLAQLYTTNQDARVAVRSLNALPFLKEDEVMDAFLEIRLRFETQFPTIVPLYDYFARNYVGHVFYNSLFPLEIWNCHESVKNHMSRTNNGIEGWHNAFRGKFNSPHPPLSKLIKAFKEEELDVQARVQLFQINPQAGIAVRPRLKKYVKVDEAIESYVDDYDNWHPPLIQRSVLDHLKVLQFQLAKYTV